MKLLIIIPVVVFGGAAFVDCVNWLQDHPVIGSHLVMTFVIVCLVGIFRAMLDAARNQGRMEH